MLDYEKSTSWRFVKLMMFQDQSAIDQWLPVINCNGVGDVIEKVFTTSVQRPISLGYQICSPCNTISYSSNWNEAGCYPGCQNVKVARTQNGSRGGQSMTGDRTAPLDF